MKTHKPIPVKGYTDQPQERIDLVNEGKQLEERVLRYIEKVRHLAGDNSDSGRFAAAGKTQIQFGFMGVFRAVFKPQRIDDDLPALKKSKPTALRYKGVPVMFDRISDPKKAPAKR